MIEFLLDTNIVSEGRLPDSKRKADFYEICAEDFTVPDNNDVP